LGWSDWTEGAEVGVRRGQELTGEAVTAARWFRWKSGHEEWPGSVSEVRGSSPRGRSGQWEADAAAHGEHWVAGVEEGGGSGARCSGCAR
jgi:hypothetical protein